MKIATREDFTAEGVQSILDRRNWVILTPENPRGKQVPEVENSLLRARFEDWIRDCGIEYIRVEGNYGYPEKFYVLLDVTYENARRIGILFKQDTIVTREGLVFLRFAPQRISTTPARSVIVDPKLEEYYTQLPDGTRFTLTFDDTK